MITKKDYLICIENMFAQYKEQDIDTEPLNVYKNDILINLFLDILNNKHKYYRTYNYTIMMKSNKAIQIDNINKAAYPLKYGGYTNEYITICDYFNELSPMKKQYYYIIWCRITINNAIFNDIRIGITWDDKLITINDIAEVDNRIEQLISEESNSILQQIIKCYKNNKNNLWEFYVNVDNFILTHED